MRGVIASLFAVFSVIFIGCATSGEGVKPLQSDIKNPHAAYEAIVATAKNEGYRVTEFKSNEVIVEKSEGEKTCAASIRIYDGEIFFESDENAPCGELSELRENIEEALEKGSSEH